MIPIEFYNNEYFHAAARMIKPHKKPNVLHRQTCDRCGAKLVNVYYDKVRADYACKRCRDIMEHVSKMSMQELLDVADSNCIEPCDYCNYSYKCNHCAINCYGGNPIESPCVSDPDKWVDEDELREKITEVLIDAKET